MPGSPALPLPLYILAGGQSRRFGPDKARAEVDGRPLLCAVADALRPIATTTTVIAATDHAYEDLGLHTLGDTKPGQGPLGGLKTALRDRLDRLGDGWLILASCDLLAPDPGWVCRLAEAETPGGEPARVYRGEYFEPFPGLYHTSLLPEAQARLETPDRSFQSLIGAIGAHTTPLSEDHPGRVPQANRPEALPGVPFKKADGFSNS